MDSDELVRRITTEVLRQLDDSSEQPSVPSRRSVGAGGGGRALVLLTGSRVHLQAVLDQIGHIADLCSATTVVMSPSADKIIGTPAVRAAAPDARVLLDGDVEALLGAADVIYLPSLSLTGASKMAHLQPDSLVCILGIYGLMRGLPVYASKDSLIPEEVGPGPLPAGVQRRLEMLLTELTEMGVQLRSLSQLTAVGAAPAVAARAPASSHTSSPCAQKQDDECDGCGNCVSKRPNAVAQLVSIGAERVAAAVGTGSVPGDIARAIDHTLLKPDATESQVRKLCDEARQYVFASVCVNPSWVALCAELLTGSPVKVCTVVGFPLGATTPTTKAIETRDAVANGADEIDMVINVGALKSGDDDRVRRDIEAVVDAARGRAIVKVILETSLLSREEKIRACQLCKQAGADFVKTSTGFGGGGATVEDIALMRKTVGPEMGVKASGGVGDLETAQAMVAAGATRIGASASVAIATGKKTKGGGY